MRAIHPAALRSNIEAWDVTPLPFLFFLAGGIPSLRDVAGLAALREEQVDLMGRSHATTQRRNVREKQN
jgi:hypothetical protein